MLGATARADAPIAFEAPERDFETIWLGYECDDPVKLGVLASGGLISIPPGTRRPEETFRASVSDGTVGEWLPAVGPSALLELGLPMQPETPCTLLSQRELTQGLELAPGLLLPLDGDEFLAGDQAGLWRVNEADRHTPFDAWVATSTEAPPSGAGYFDSDGQLWLYGDGRLWVGPRQGGEFAAMPPNPGWIRCRAEPSTFLGTYLGQQCAMMAAETPDGLQIYTIGDEGTAARFDVRERAWTVLRPAEPTEDGLCRYRELSLARASDGFVVGARAGAARVLAMRGDEVRDEGFDGIRIVREVQGEIYAGRISGGIVRRDDGGQWTDVYDSSAGDVMILQPLDGALLFGGLLGALSIWEEDYGACRTQAIESIGRHIFQTVELETRIIASTTGRRDGPGPGLLELKRVARSVCEPHLP